MEFKITKYRIFFKNTKKLKNGRKYKFWLKMLGYNKIMKTGKIRSLDQTLKIILKADRDLITVLVHRILPHTADFFRLPKINNSLSFVRFYY